MISEERSSYLSKQALNFPVGLLIGSPKKRLAKLGRKPSNGSVQSNNSDSTVRSAESAGVRQPAKSKIRRHNNRLSTVFNRSPTPSDGGSRAEGRGRCASGEVQLRARDDPAELSSQMSAPGILKVFGSDICQGAHYKSVLATIRSSAKELVKEALERYCLEKEDARQYVLCDVIGQTGADHQWKRECFRVVGDSEKPLVLQSLWRPKDGFSRRFEIQRRRSVEEQSAKEADTVTAGINAQARRLQKGRSRVTSLFVDGSGEAGDLGLWRSLSEMDLPAMGKEAGRFSVHPPFDFPYFLLLQGYSHKQDFVVYLMSGTSTVFGCCQEHSDGEDEERLKVDILLFAPDVLPQHCCVRRLDPAGGPAGPGGPWGPGEPKQTLTMLKPLHGAPVTRNGFLLKGEVELSPGDLVGLGKHYLFMFKDPTGATVGATQTPPWMARLCPDEAERRASSCLSCGSSFRNGADRTSRRRPPCWRDPDGSVASLCYDLEQEERVLQEVLDMSDPSGQEPKLTPAFLLCLCIQHSAANFRPTDLRRLLLQMAGQIQLVMWEKTKELAATQPETAPCDGHAQEVSGPLRMEALGPGLRPLLLWMANSIELLQFIQRQVPLLLPRRQPQEEQGPYDSEMSTTRTACEEAMSVLEEVIMFAFQQSVYYLTKSMYSALPGLLDGNPFSESGQLRVPQGVGVILEVLTETLELLKVFQVHPDISRQLCAYLFYFVNASLFNALMERGSGGGFYQWSRGVQIRANLDLLMDWAQSAGLGDQAVEFFQKLSAAVNILATPKESLLQASWSSLRAEFPALNAAQLHHMLREYNSADILESFDKHPPLVLPCGSFHLELGGPHPEPGLFLQLQRLQGFIQQWPPSETQDPCPPTHQLSGCEAVLTQKLKILELQDGLPGRGDLGCHKGLALDPSCLLTPPNTPQGLELGRGEADDREGSVEETNQTVDEDEVFTVELCRGPHGLGMALVDGV
ncbi:hypothetical protein NHX12_032065, partial [Muraenolepis orangiensis]